MKLNHFLTSNEQKVVFFLLTIGFLGLSYSFLRKNLSENEDVDVLNSIITSTQRVRYDINTVNEDELKTIPGIGNVRARAIIEYRNNEKPIAVEDLVSIKGIGPKTVDIMKEYFYADND